MAIDLQARREGLKKEHSKLNEYARVRACVRACIGICNYSIKKTAYTHTYVFSMHTWNRRLAKGNRQ